MRWPPAQGVRQHRHRVQGQRFLPNRQSFCRKADIGSAERNCKWELIGGLQAQGFRGCREPLGVRFVLVELGVYAEGGQVGLSSQASYSQAEIGVIGGSGFYSFLDEVTEVTLNTPYGSPSAPVALGHIEGRRVAFLPRHGAHHEHPPHMLNYRANLWALSQLGVRRILGPCAAGSLQPHIRPGDFVICDQLVDRTSGRSSSFYNGPGVHHVSWADPYCPELRATFHKAAHAEGVSVHDTGTVVVVQGPRFSTRAESRWYRQAGWDVVNMTQYPEAYLARELGICYAAVALVTDYDVGLEGVEGIEPVTMEDVFRFFNENLGRLRSLLFRALPAIPELPTCLCHDGLNRSFLPA